MVCQAAAHLVEVVDAGLGRGLEALPVAHGSTGNLGELGDVASEARGVDAHEAVRAERRQHAEAVLLLLGGKALVVGQVARRVIRGADALHVELADEALGVELGRGEQGVGAVPNLLGIGACDLQVDAEDAAELQVTPLVDGIAGRLLEGVNKRQVLGVVVVAADDGLRRAVGTEQTPLVVVAKAVVVEPHLREVLVALVLANLGRHEVAVVVDDRHALGMLMEQPTSPIRRQQKVIIQQHGNHPLN